MLMERIKIFFPDETYRTVRVDERTTVEQVCQKCCHKKGLDPKEHTLQFTEFILGQKTEDGFHRVLESFEILLDILNNASRNSMCRFNVINFREVQAQVKFQSDVSESDAYDDDIAANGNGYQKQGWMEKLGVQFGIRFHMWRRNYFVLDGDELRYWKTFEEFRSRKRQPRGMIELQQPWAHVKIISDEPFEGNWSFQLVTMKKVIELRVKSYKLLVEWANALHRPPPPEQLIFEVLQTEINTTEQVRGDEFERWISELSNMQSLLSHRRANDAFLRFLRSENCETWLLFLIDVDDFRNQSKPERISVCAEKLFRQYIDSPHPLPQCTPQMKSYLEEEIKREIVSPSLFDDLYNLLFRALEKDYHPPFLKSRHFVELLCGISFRRSLWPTDLYAQNHPS